MAAGDRNEKIGKPKDIVRHFCIETKGNGEPVCKQKNYGYSTNNISDVTCEKCRKKVFKDNIWFPGR